MLLLTSGCASNRYAYDAHKVNSSDREKHQQCVYFALTDMELGERCNWYSQVTSGTVQVMNYYPANGSYCATLYNTVWNGSKSRYWQEVACKEGSGNQWRFLK